MKKEKYFIVLTHTYTPMPGQKNRHEVQEKCEFVTRVSNSHLSSATVVIDVVNKSFVKNRIKDSTYEQFESHISKQHPREWEEFSKLMIEQGVFQAA